MKRMPPSFGGKSGPEIDSSPGVESLHHGMSEGSEFHADDSRSRGRGKSRKNRIIFNAAQLNALEKLFQDIPYPDMELRMKIAERLDIDEGRVTVWFQNRRAKFRRVSGKNIGEGGSIPTKSPQVASPASVSTQGQDQYGGESAPYMAPGSQNYVHTVPVSGVEFSTWVNHSHSGDQSTVVHQSRDTDRLRNQDDYQRYDIPQTEVSSQRKTLDWLQNQQSPQAVSPYSVATSSPQTPHVTDPYHPSNNHHADFNHREQHFASPTDSPGNHGHSKVSPYAGYSLSRGPHGNGPPATLTRSNSSDVSPNITADYAPGDHRTIGVNGHFDPRPNTTPANYNSYTMGQNPNTHTNGVHERNLTLSSLPPRDYRPSDAGYRLHQSNAEQWRGTRPSESVNGRQAVPPATGIRQDDTSTTIPHVTSQSGHINLPPNKDVKELHQNHLGEALMRLAASQRHIAPNYASTHVPTNTPAQVSINSSAPFPTNASSRSHMPHYHQERRVHEDIPGSIPQYVKHPVGQSYSNIDNDARVFESQYSQGQGVYPSGTTAHQERRNGSCRPDGTRQLGTTQDTQREHRNEHVLDDTRYNYTSTHSFSQQRLSLPDGQNVDNQSVDENMNRRKRARQSSSDSDGHKPKEGHQRKKRFRKRKKVRRAGEQPLKPELPLSQLSSTRRMVDSINSDSDDATTPRHRQIPGTDKIKARPVRRRDSSGDDAAVSSRSERRSSSSTIFSSTSDSDFETPYYKRAKRSQVSSDNRPNSAPGPKAQRGPTAKSNEARAKPGDPSTVLRHGQSTVPSSNAAVEKVGPSVNLDNLRPGDISGINNNSERVIRTKDEEETYRSNKGRDRNSANAADRAQAVNDSESASLLNFFFGPKTPDIPLDNDELDEEPLAREARTNNEEIISESLELAQMCGSPSPLAYSEQSMYHDYHHHHRKSGHLPFGQMKEPHNSVGRVMAYPRDIVHGGHRQYTIHYGNGSVVHPMNKQPQTKPRGIIRPVPQRVGQTSPHSTAPAPFEGRKGNSSESVGGDQSHATRPTGTVRPWCDDLPKATVNPEHDISRPVREPVPMDGAPPNKVCTMVEDALSPVDLLAKYLTWTGNCYVSQNKYQQMYS